MPQKKLPKAPNLTSQTLTLSGPLKKALDDAQSPVLSSLEHLYIDLKDTRKDAVSDDIFKRVLPLLERGFQGASLTSILRRVAPRITDAQRAHLLAQIRAYFGVDLLQIEPSLGRLVSKWVDSNVALIRSIPNDLALDLGKTVQGAFERGSSWRNLSGELRERFDVSRSRANVIARDQVSKLFSQVAETRQKKLGLRSYVWRTGLDPRVRPEHRRREGKIFSWDAPPFDGHPGHPILCRCEAQPNFSELQA